MKEAGTLLSDDKSGRVSAGHAQDAVPAQKHVVKRNGFHTKLEGTKTVGNKYPSSDVLRSSNDSLEFNVLAIGPDNHFRETVSRRNSGTSGKTPTANTPACKKRVWFATSTQSCNSLDVTTNMYLIFSFFVDLAVI